MILTEYVGDLFDADATPKMAYFHRDIETSVRTHDGRIQWSNAKTPHPELWYEVSEIQRVGVTGYNFVKKQVESVGFEFDGDSHGGGHPAETIELIQAKLSTVPFVDLYRSTSGDGLHAHVRLEKPVAMPKSQMIHLARHIVETISKSIDFPLSEYVDAQGGNLWLYHA